MATAANPLDPADPAVPTRTWSRWSPRSTAARCISRARRCRFSAMPSPGLPVLRHKGIYAYSPGFLERFVAWPPSPLEKAESLEQLRALENGASIKVLLTSDTSPGVDTPEQALEIERILAAH
jgi:3-deoxy-manno-octulosonate cytidylyltransferase (CMP-KDO synthetase)